MNNSPKWQLNWIDWQKWVSNLAMFLLPVAVIYLGSVSVNLQSGFSWSAFGLSLPVQGAAALYVVNALLDLFRKFVAGPAV